MSDDAFEPRKKTQHDIGQDLSPLSIAEIDERVMLLEGEIARLREARARKLSTQAAADALFRRGGS
jgi:uncharacterized small protein (DUF1192 family)